MTYGMNVASSTGRDWGEMNQHVPVSKDEYNLLKQIRYAAKRGGIALLVQVEKTGLKWQPVRPKNKVSLHKAKSDI